MSILEILSRIFIWAVVGVWICYKNNWFKGEHWFKSDKDSDYFACFVAVVTCPCFLLIEFFRVFIIKRWP